MARRSLEERELAALVEEASDAGAKEGLLEVSPPSFEPLLTELVKRQGWRCFPPRDVAALEAAIAPAEWHHARAARAFERSAATPAPPVAIPTTAVSGLGVLVAGAGLAIALPAGPPRQSALGLGLAVAALLVVAMTWGAGHAIRVQWARLGLWWAWRRVAVARRRVASARAHERERARWIFDATRLVKETYDFHRDQAELALAVTTEAPFARDEAKVLRAR
jgi:hypothetical protein